MPSDEDRVQSPPQPDPRTNQGRNRPLSHAATCGASARAAAIRRGTKFGFWNEATDAVRAATAIAVFPGDACRTELGLGGGRGRGRSSGALDRRFGDFVRSPRANTVSATICDSVTNSNLLGDTNCGGVPGGCGSGVATSGHDVSTRSKPTRGTRGAAVGVCHGKCFPIGSSLNISCAFPHNNAPSPSNRTRAGMVVMPNLSRSSWPRFPEASA